ncbi:TBC1 domain family member 9B [Dissostichus eleginoides]|uniref:TBC1 domain family member 9B n=1 Tax=Dissostichus eleginoides TaxID=100907 RepID=A0AAD9CN52_DISEL|nr:TBC1 domain family member 9B [Dissostichus eleginoides]
MWIPPEEVLLAGPLWVSERANPFFILQRRRGHGRGGGSAGGHPGRGSGLQRPGCSLSDPPADGRRSDLLEHRSSRKEITEHWDWLESNLLQTISIFDNDEDVTTFVKGKISGIIAEENRLKQGEEQEEDCGKFREAELKMRRLFWKGRVPRQGWLYLSVNHLCFYSFLLGKEVTLVVQWSEVTQLEKNATLVFPESVRVSTRHTEYFFSMFLNINDTFKLMEQLANMAMRQLLDNETLKNVSALKRDLDARAKNEHYRTMFRLTQDERLDGHTDCTLWAPFAKMHVVGQLFISNNYICFNSREEDLCQLIIPLRELPMMLFTRDTQLPMMLFTRDTQLPMMLFTRDTQLPMMLFTRDIQLPMMLFTRDTQLPMMLFTRDTQLPMMFFTRDTQLPMMLFTRDTQLPMMLFTRDTQLPMMLSYP